MTREKFIEKAIKAAERQIEVPPGWWGTWRHVRSPDGVEVRFTSHGRC